MDRTKDLPFCPYFYKVAITARGSVIEFGQLYMDRINGTEEQILRTNKTRLYHSSRKRYCRLRRVSPGSQPRRPIRVDSANWPRGNLVIVELLGGIIAQLIQQTMDQLGDARECIAYYELECEKLEKRLETLQRLQQIQEDFNKKQI